MEELLKLLLLFVVGSVAGFINVMAGGRVFMVGILYKLALDSCSWHRFTI